MSGAIEISHADASVREVIERYQREGMQASPEEFRYMLRTGKTPLEQRGEVLTVEEEKGK